MSIEFEFWRLASEIERPSIREINNNPFAQRTAAIYVDAVCELASALGVDNFSCQKIGDQFGDQNIVLDRLFCVQHFMQQFRARHIKEIDGTLKSAIIKLDESWRSRVTSYVSRIRDIVRDAKIKDNLRQAIFDRLINLEREVERNQTRLESVLQAGLSITRAVGQGAKDLEPAVRLYNRMSGSLGGLQVEQEENKQPLQLSAPETLGLLPPSEELGEK